MHDMAKRQAQGTAGPDYTMPPNVVRIVTVTGSAVVQVSTIKPTSGIATETVYDGVSTTTTTLDAPTSGVSTTTLSTISTSTLDATTPTITELIVTSTTVFSTTVVSTITACESIASDTIVYTTVYV